MDKISPLLAAMLAHGPVKADGYTYFMYGNTLRKCKSKRGPKKNISEGEMNNTRRFTEARKMWQVYKRAIGNLDIWKIMARETGVSKSDALFHTMNGGCFRPGEGVWSFQTFRFSTGTLEAPSITGVGREGWKVTLHWTNDEERPKASMTDRVFVGYFYESAPRSPQLAKNIDAHRGDGAVTIEIPAAEQPEGVPLHLYLFFGDKDLKRFSPSGYAGI